MKTKILIYNWTPFGLEFKVGGGVAIYCKNLVEAILKENPAVEVYFLSSGFSYNASTTATFIRTVKECSTDRLHVFDIVNSPVPAEQRFIYPNPDIALKNNLLKTLFKDFLVTHGPFNTIHFNNLEGISLDIFDLKQDFIDTTFIFSIHNYIPICLTGTYFRREINNKCNSTHLAKDCLTCTKLNSIFNPIDLLWDKGCNMFPGVNPLEQTKWLRETGLLELLRPPVESSFLNFSKEATAALNKNCDYLLAVSQKVKDIAIENGLNKDKLYTSYIGTHVAEYQLRKSSSLPSKNDLKILFLGSNAAYIEKGYQFLVDALRNLDLKYSRRLDLLFTTQDSSYVKILKHHLSSFKFKKVEIKVNYTHDELKQLCKDRDLSIIPVLWEDCLPQIAIESVANGVPILCSSAGGASELTSNELFKFECGNKKDLQDKIIYFLENPEKIDSYWEGHKGLVTLKDHYLELAECYYKLK